MLTVNDLDRTTRGGFTDRSTIPSARNTTAEGVEALNARGARMHQAETGGPQHEETTDTGPGFTVTNEDFLKTVFGKAPEGAYPWVTGFAEDPLTVKGGWHGTAATNVLPWSIKPQHNNFFAISSFKPGSDGKVHRRKGNFAACHVIMIDDIGTKVQEDRLKLPPSYLLETSPGNYQAGYILDPPETDGAKVNRFLDEMIRAGLAIDGKDPGMKGVTRYCRLPVGVNSKAKYVKKLGEPFQHWHATWHPTRTGTLDALAETFGLDLTPPKAAAYAPRTEVPAWAAEVLPKLSERGLYTGASRSKPGAHDVTCPWLGDHTDEDDSGTMYFEPSADNNWTGGFVCHHGHCKDVRNIRDLADFLDIDTSDDLEGEPKHTDRGNAIRFIRDHRGRVRWCKLWNKWLVWNGRYWEPDDTEKVARLAGATARKMYKEAGQLKDEGERKAMAKWAWKCEALKVQRDMLASARPYVPVLPADLDSDTWLLNVRNGTIDLRTGKLRPHAQEDLITRSIDVDYDPGVECLLWDRVLLEIFDGSTEMVRFVQKCVGYSLTGSVREKVILILWGIGDTGKSLVIGVLDRLFGEYGDTMSEGLLNARKFDQHPTEVAALFGKRFVSAVETKDGQQLNEARVKYFTGGDRRSARRMHENPWTYAPTDKMWLATNYRPAADADDDAFWNRVRLIPFTVKFHREETGKLPKADPALGARLQEDLSGVLRWAVEGCLAWQREGLGQPAAVQQAGEAYRADQDVMARFFEECCVFDKRDEATAKELYRGYAAWCEAGREKPVSKKKLGEKLGAVGLTKRESSGATIWGGIGLRAETAEVF